MTAASLDDTAQQPELTDAQRAQQMYRDAVQTGSALTGKQIGDAFGKTDRWGRDQIQASGSAPRGAGRRPAGRVPAPRRRQPAGTDRASGTTSDSAIERNPDPVVVSFRKSGDSTSAEVDTASSAEAGDGASAELVTALPEVLPSAPPRNTSTEAEPTSAATSAGVPGGAGPEATAGVIWLRAALGHWPLYLIGAAAFVAIWGGWVGLGKLTGFGNIELLPGLSTWKLDTAITLPAGVEAYAAYALKVAVSPPPGLSTFGRKFASWSAGVALCLGAAGQVAYHLMAAAEVTTAPWQITTFVSCLPVAVMGAAAALTHLVRAGKRRAR